MALRQRSWWGLALTAAAVSFIAWFTLRPSPEDISFVAQSDFLCLYPCGQEEVRDAVLNVLLFVPLGCALGLWLPGWLALLLCVTATCGVEYAQWAWLAGRDASLRDLLTNAAGGGLGVWLAHRWRRVVFPSATAAARLATAAGTGWLVMVALTARGVQPSLPSTRWWGQWAPALGQFEQWRGTLRAADLNGIVLPNGEAETTPALHAALRQDSALVSARIRTGPAPTELAPIVAIFDGDQREIVVLGQRGPDLVVRLRTGLFAGGLRGQLVQFRGALALPPGEAVTVRGGIVDRGWQLEVSNAAGLRRWHTRWSAGMLWTGLLPFKYFLGSEAPYFNALWLGATLLPASFWLTRATRRRLSLTWLALIIGLGLGVVSPLAGLSPSPPLEWLGTVAGAVAGLIAGSSIRSRGSVPSVTSST